MNFTDDRALQVGSHTGCDAGATRLETLDTVSAAAFKPHGASNLQRSLTPLLLAAALGLSAIAAGAQDTPKKDDKPAVAKDAAKKDDKAAAQPAAPAGPAPGAVTVTGLIDGYFQTNYQHPSSKGKPTFAVPFSGVNATRAFDYKDGFALSLAEININRTAGKGFPLGITATLTAFDTPPVVYATEPGAKAGYEAIQQLYLTYTPNIFGHDVAIDFGKFVTSFGNEVIESSSNDNYSRGLLFTYAIPFYHTGFRLATPITKQLALTLGVVNGWNNTADDNDDKSFFAAFSWTPDPHFTGIFNIMTGTEGTGAYGKIVPTAGGGQISTNLYEFVPTINVTSKLKLAGDVTYGDGAGRVGATHVSGKWLGMAAYARYQWTPQVATAVRFEQFEDMPGAGKLPGNTAGGLRFGAGYAKVRSFTATLEYAAFHNKLISRLEYRHDRANQNFGPIGPDQDTLTLGEVFKF